MKKGIIFSMLLCFMLAGVSAQTVQNKEEKKKENMETFKAKRVAYITEKMKLTPDEAQAFWPICNELQEKKFEINKTLRENRKIFRDPEKKPTDADYLKIIDANADAKIKEAELDKEYLEKFKKILSPEKIYKYIRAEEDFMKQMFSQRHKDNKGEKGNRPVPPRAN